MVKHHPRSNKNNKPVEGRLACNAIASFLNLDPIKKKAEWGFSKKEELWGSVYDFGVGHVFISNLRAEEKIIRKDLLYTDGYTGVIECQHGIFLSDYLVRVKRI